MEMQWNNADLKSCMCWDRSKSDWCEDPSTQCKAYFSSLGWAAVGLYFAALMIVYAIVYFGFRIFFCTVRSCCAPGSKGTSPMSRKRYLAGLALVTVLYVAATAWFAAYMRHEVHPGLQSLYDVSNNYADTMMDDMEPVGSALNTLSVILAVPPISMSFQETADTWGSHVGKTSDAVMGVPTTLLVIWFIPLAILAICCFLKACNVHRVVPDIVTVVTICVVMLLGFCQSFVGVSGKVARDLCADQIPVTAQAANILDSELQCGTDRGPLGGIKVAADYYKHTYVSLQNENQEEPPSLRPLCSERFICPEFDKDSSFLHLLEVMANSTLNGASGDCNQCSILECTTMCEPNSHDEWASQQVVQLYEMVVQELKVIDEHGVVPWVDCTSFLAWIGTFSEQTCIDGSVSKTVPNLGNIAIATLIIALLVVGAVSVSPYVYKRATPAEEAAPETARLVTSQYVYGTPVNTVQGIAINEAQLPDTDAECRAAE